MEQEQFNVISDQLSQIISAIEYQNKLQETLLEIIDAKSKKNHSDKSKLQENIGQLLAGILQNSGAKVSKNEIMSQIKENMEGLLK